MNGNYTANGNFYVTTAVPPAAGDYEFQGIRRAADGATYVTTVASATDVWVVGDRVSLLGQLVVANLLSPIFDAGHPHNSADAALSRQLNQIPVATDAFINGLTVGPTGGIYMSTTP